MIMKIRAGKGKVQKKKKIILMIMIITIIIVMIINVINEGKKKSRKRESTKKKKEKEKNKDEEEKEKKKNKRKKGTKENEMTSIPFDDNGIVKINLHTDDSVAFSPMKFQKHSDDMSLYFDHENIASHHELPWQRHAKKQAVQPYRLVAI